MNNKTPWYFTTAFLVTALLTVGPLALPLLWLNPRYTTTQKILWTVVVSAATYWLTITSIAVFKQALQQARDLGLIQ